MRGFAPTLVPVLAAVLSMPAAAQEAVPTSRYSITPSNGGFVRLDTETGTVSHCLKRDGTWLCEPAGEQSPSRDQMVELTRTVEALSSRLDRLEAALATLATRVETLATAAAAQPDTGGDVAAVPAEDATGDEAKAGLASRLITPLIALVGNLKRDRPAGQAE